MIDQVIGTALIIIGITYPAITIWKEVRK